MRSETKLVKTASRSALAGGGERDRLPNDCKAPEAGWLVSQNRLGQASASLGPRRDEAVRPAHDDSKTQQLHRSNGQADSRRSCANVLPAQMLAGLHLGDHDCRCCLAS